MTEPNADLVCRICQHETRPHLVNVRGYDLLRCPTCGFVQVRQEPDPAALNAIYQESYFSHNKYRDQKTLQAEEQRRLGLLRAHVPGGSRVLEVGCGSGSFLSAAKAEFEMHGFDLSAAGVEIARRDNPELADRIWVGRLEEQDIPAEHFDAICAWDVIEHIWDPREMGRQLLRYLKPGGVLLLSTPNIGAPIARLMGKRWAFMTPPEHLSFFNRSSMQWLFNKALGAQIVLWRSLGKRANLGFILYKLRRVFPLFPAMIPRLFETGFLAKLSVYVPTADIQYVIIRKA